MKTKDIIEYIEVMDFENFKLNKEILILEYKLRMINKAIERAGLEKHIEQLIKEIEADPDEVPF